VFLSASVYLLMVYLVTRNPFVATAVGHVTGLATAYALHSRWSFAGPRQGRETLTIVRFLIVSTFCFGLNNLWVALTTVVLGLPVWSPVPLMVFVTPVVSFVLNRWWVFRAQLHPE
jgi:putative flippase GtrA